MTKSFYELAKHFAGSIDDPSDLVLDEKSSRGAVQTKAEVLTAIRSNQNKIQSFGVKKLGLFGSFARDEQHQDSDVDLLVELEQDKKTFKNFMQLSFFLEDILNRRVELVTTESVSPYIQPYIVKDVEYVAFAS